jgi:hypothetical protein
MIRETAMVMVTEKDFYLVCCELPEGTTAVDAAKAHGEANDHVKRIECLCGKVLWERVIH